jgi:predicted MFS family arabinose efflux permease
MQKEKFVLYILASVNFTHVMDVMIMMPLGDVFMDTFAISPQQFSLLVSSYAIAAFCSSIIAVSYLDTFDRRNALLIMYGGMVIGTILCATSTSYEMLLFLRFLTGFFGGVIGALALSVVSDVFEFERRGKAMGTLMAGFSAAAALGVPLGLYLADVFDWRFPFFFIGGSGIILWSLIFFRFPRMTVHLNQLNTNRSIFRILRTILGNRNQLNALILGIVLVLGHFIIIPFIAPYMTRNVGFTQREISYIYFIGGTLTVFSSPYFGLLTDRYGVQRVFRTLVFISFVPVIAITHMPRVAIPLALIATSVFFVVGSGRMIPPQTLITASIGRENRGSFMAVKSALQQLGIALAAAISGMIVVLDETTQTLENYNIVGYLSIAICLLAIYLASKIYAVKENE